MTEQPDNSKLNDLAKITGVSNPTKLKSAILKLYNGTPITNKSETTVLGELLMGILTVEPSKLSKIITDIKGLSSKHKSYVKNEEIEENIGKKLKEILLKEEENVDQQLTNLILLLNKFKNVQTEPVKTFNEFIRGLITHDQADVTTVLRKLRSRATSLK